VENFLLKKLFDKKRFSIYNELATRIIKKLRFRRCIYMKRTFQPNTRKRSKKMGFLARVKTAIVKNRRKKGRKVLSR
jgi:large subunit ribosomal protein L34